MWRAVAGVVALGVVALSACGSGDGKAVYPKDTTTTTATKPESDVQILPCPPPQPVSNTGRLYRCDAASP